MDDINLVPPMTTDDLVDNPADDPAEVDPSTWPAEIFWYRSPYRHWEEGKESEAGTWVPDPEMLVEIVIRDPQSEDEEGFDFENWHAGSIRCENIAAALTEVQRLQSDRGMILWRGGFAVRFPEDRYPREWCRISHPVPGQEWPEDTLELGKCQECGATGVCPRCDGVDLPPDDYCLCGQSGACPICGGTASLPAPRHFVEAMQYREMAYAEIAELEEERKR